MIFHAEELFMSGGQDFAYWQSESINIAPPDDSVAISFELLLLEFREGFDEEDTIRATYEVNGGGEVEFFMENYVPTEGIKSISGIKGNNLVIRIYCRNTWNDEAHAFDNILVRRMRSLYSRGNGNWSDPNNWSITRGGGPAGYIPNSATPVIITDGDDIVLDVNSAEAYGLVLEDNSSLTYGTNSRLALYSGELNIASTAELTDDT
jgi:hypothetical protein